MPATWPYIRYFSPIISGVTTITKAWGDALEDALVAAFMGTKALKRVDVRTDADTVPATGAAVGEVRAETLTATTSGASLTSTTDSVPEIDHTREPTLTWKLRPRSKLKAGAGEMWFREYDGTAGLARIRTVNAAWDEGTAKWVADDATKAAYAVQLDPTGETLHYHAAAANWAAWGSSSLSTVTGTNTRVFDGPVTAGGNLTGTHFVSSAGNPTYVLDANAGFTAAMSVTGTDASGYITFTPDGVGLATGTQFDVVFDVAYDTAPKAVLLVAKNLAAIDLFATAGKNVLVSTVAVNAFRVSTSGASALTAATTYEWWYWVI